MDASMFEGYSHNRRDNTLTPLCGTHRIETKGSRVNPLLQKPQVGCVRTTSYDLPPDFQFTYGMEMVRTHKPRPTHCPVGPRSWPPEARRGGSFCP